MHRTRKISKENKNRSKRMRTFIIFQMQNNFQSILILIKFIVSLRLIDNFETYAI